MVIAKSFVCMLYRSRNMEIYEYLFNNATDLVYFVKIKFSLTYMYLQYISSFFMWNTFGLPRSMLSCGDVLLGLAAARWLQLVEVYAVADVSYGHGRSEHCRHSLFNIDYVSRIVRIIYMLYPRTKHGSSKVVRTLDIDLVIMVGQYELGH